jgi:hypothetical protein
MVAHLSPLKKYTVKDRPLESSPRHTGALIKAPIPLPIGASISKTALILPRDLSHEQWSSIGKNLHMLTDCVQFWCGDWWRQGYHRYGERKAAVFAKGLFRHSFATLMQWGWVAHRVETSRRREVLSFSHHVEVAKLQPEEQEKYLARAIRGNHTVKQLRQHIHDDRRHIYPEEVAEELLIEHIHFLILRANKVCPEGWWEADFDFEALERVAPGLFEELDDAFAARAERCRKEAIKVHEARMKLKRRNAVSKSQK